jgi:hypothetical protein
MKADEVNGFESVAVCVAILNKDVTLQLAANSSVIFLPVWAL